MGKTFGSLFSCTQYQRLKLPRIRRTIQLLLVHIFSAAEVKGIFSAFHIYYLNRTLFRTRMAGFRCPDLKDLNGQPKKWQEIRPFVFQEVDGQDLLIFKKMENPSRYRIIIPFPFFVYDAAPWYLNSKFVTTVLVFTIGIFLLTLILWPVAAIIRRYYGKRLELEPSQSSFRRWTKLVTVINLVILAAYALFIIQGFQSLGILTSKNDNIIRIFQVIAVFAGLGSLILILKAFRAFPNPGFWSKLYKLAVVLACIGFIWILIVGRFLDFSLRY